MLKLQGWANAKKVAYDQGVTAWASGVIFVLNMQQLAFFKIFPRKNVLANSWMNCFVGCEQGFIARV